jgi:cytidylate kinase
MPNFKNLENCLIAIDGPAGVGKTTIGQMLAAELDCPYLDTGAMYRAVAYLAIQNGVNVEDVEGLTKLARNLIFASRNATPEEAQDGRQYTVLVNGEDVSQALRRPEVEAIVSPVAAVPSVRVALVDKQREIARNAGSMVMIGRDIGSVVLKDIATLKLYLDASPEVRAARRTKQTGTPAKTETTKQQIEQRDKIDSQRTASPLVVPEGAVVINTDNLTPQEVLQAALTALAKALE